MEIGDLIRFTYPAVHKQGTRAHHKTPQILVLHNDWEGLVHGLKFEKPFLSDDEMNVIRMLLSPKFQLDHKAALTRKNPLVVREFDSIMETVGKTTITSPYNFYQTAIKPFVAKRQWEPYRKYRLDKMTNIKVVQRAAIMLGDEQSGVFQRFADKFRHFKGPKLPRFRS